MCVYVCGSVSMSLCMCVCVARLKARMSSKLRWLSQPNSRRRHNFWRLLLSLTPLQTHTPSSPPLLYSTPLIPFLPLSPLSPATSPRWLYLSVGRFEPVVSFRFLFASVCFACFSFSSLVFFFFFILCQFSVLCFLFKPKDYLPGLFL